MRITLPGKLRPSFLVPSKAWMCPIREIGHVRSKLLLFGHGKKQLLGRMVITSTLPPAHMAPDTGRYTPAGAFCWRGGGVILSFAMATETPVPSGNQNLRRHGVPLQSMARATSAGRSHNFAGGNFKGLGKEQGEPLESCSKEGWSKESFNFGCRLSFSV